MFFKRTDNLPLTLTSYDLLKAFTLVFMLIDHAGAFVLLHDPWWRVFGRLGFPAWFFLCGYSNTKTVEPKLWAGAGLLIAANMILGQYLLPASALVSYIVIRLILPHVAPWMFANGERLAFAVLALVVAAETTNYIFEYGTLAFLLAMFGYAVRHKDELGIKNYSRVLFCAFSVIMVMAFEALMFGFNQAQSAVAIAGVCLISLVMFHFRPMEYPRLTAVLPNALNAVIRFGGRYTLEVYVFHLIAIKIWQLAAHPELFSFFAPTIFPNFKY